MNGTPPVLHSASVYDSETLHASMVAQVCVAMLYMIAYDPHNFHDFKTRLRIVIDGFSITGFTSTLPQVQAKAGEFMDMPDRKSVV